MITFLNILVVVLKAVELLSVTAIISIGVDLAFFENKQKKTTTKSESRQHSIKKLIHLVVGFIVETKTTIHDKMVARAVGKQKARIRRQKEESADGGFFEESFVHGFDQSGELLYRGMHRFPTDEMEALAKRMDEVADSQIFENTEVL